MVLTERPTVSQRLLRIATLSVLLVSVVQAYDFTNLNLSSVQDVDVPLPINKPPEPQEPDPYSHVVPHAMSEQSTSAPAAAIHPSSAQSPMHWILSRLFNETDTKRKHKEEGLHAKEERVRDRQHDAHGPAEDRRKGTFAHPSDEEAIRYNVSSLGLKDPFARYSTRLSYDYSIDISEPHDNRRGSMLSLLNGTVFPFGSVGAMMALGWSGTSNETIHHSHHTQHDATVNSTANGADSRLASSASQSPTSSSPSGTSSQSSSGSSTSTSSVRPHSEGLSGVWLAFTSQHAVTGGYTLQSSRVSATNNIVFHNVTFRSNITIDAQGYFTFSLTMGTVDESDQEDDAAAAMVYAASNSTAGAHSASYLNMFDRQDTYEARQRIREERRRRGAKPTRLDGPRCTELDSVTNNTEAVFRMRCEGGKIDFNET